MIVIRMMINDHDDDDHDEDSCDGHNNDDCRIMVMIMMIGMRMLSHIGDDNGHKDDDYDDVDTVWLMDR
jgi:hypothetical protein